MVRNAPAPISPPARSTKSRPMSLRVWYEPAPDPEKVVEYCAKSGSSPSMRCTAYPAIPSMTENAAWWRCMGESHSMYVSESSGRCLSMAGSTSTCVYVMTSGPIWPVRKWSGFRKKNRLAFLANGKSSGTACSCR